MKHFLFSLLLVGVLSVEAFGQQNPDQDLVEVERKKRPAVHILPGSDAFWHHNTIGSSSLFCENPHGLSWNVKCSLFGSFPPEGRQIVSAYLGRKILVRLLKQPDNQDNNVLSLYDETNEVPLTHVKVGSYITHFDVRDNLFGVYYIGGRADLFDLVTKDEKILDGNKRPVLDRYGQPISEVELKFRASVWARRNAVFFPNSRMWDYKGARGVGTDFPEQGVSIRYITTQNMGGELSWSNGMHVFTSMVDGLNPHSFQMFHNTLCGLSQDSSKVFLLPLSFRHISGLLGPLLKPSSHRIISVGQEVISRCVTRGGKLVVGGNDPNGLRVFSNTGKRELSVSLPVVPDYILYADDQRILVSDKKSNLCTVIYNEGSASKRLAKRILGDSVTLGPISLREQFFYQQVNEEAGDVFMDGVTDKTRAHLIEGAQFAVGPLSSGAFAFYNPVEIENKKIYERRYKKLVKELHQKREEREKKQLEEEQEKERKAAALLRDSLTLKRPQSARASAAAGSEAILRNARTSQQRDQTPVSTPRRTLSRSSSARGFGSSIPTNRMDSSSSRAQVDVHNPRRFKEEQEEKKAQANRKSR